MIQNNTQIKDLSQTSNYFTAGIGTKRDFYRPLQMITYNVDYSLWEFNVFGYHLTNMFLHLLAAIFLYFFILTLSKNTILSLLTSLLFVCHPVHTEAVAYISGRADLLATIWLLICITIYMRYLDNKKIIFYLIIILTYLLALLSKEGSLILPIILLLYHFTFRKKIPKIAYSSIILITICYILLRIINPQNLAVDSLTTSTIWQRIPGFFVALSTYLKLLLVPSNLHMEYGIPLFSWFNPYAALGLAILLTAIILFSVKRNTLIGFSIGWFFVALLPVANLYPINAFMAEHWLYLPSIGYFLLLAIFLQYLYQKISSKSLIIILICLLVIYYSFSTIRQNKYWQEPINFYKKTLAAAPTSYRAYNNLAFLYDSRGEKNKALATLQSAIKAIPNHAETYNNLANAYIRQGKIKEAFTTYQTALTLDPGSLETNYNLGSLYHDLRQYDMAITFYNKALEVDPDYIDAYNNLGIIYKNKGSITKAESMYKKAIAINPTYAKAYLNLGNLYKDSGKEEPAISQYKRALSINSQYLRAYHALALIYLKQRKYDLAIEYCNKAQALGLTDPQLLQALEPYQQGKK